MKKTKNTLSCSYCNRSLIEYLIPEDNDKHRPKFFIEATCPFCVGKSRKVGIHRHLSYSPVNDKLNVKDVITSADGDMKFIMEKTK